MDARRTAACACAALVMMALAGVAQARCPVSGSPSRDVCKYWNAILMPSAAAMAYVPRDLSEWYGGGLQVILFAWSDNSERFGPGQGKLFFDIGVLASIDSDAVLVKYRGGAKLSFERNASRNWVIPFYGASVGGLHESSLGSRGFVDGSLGLHVLYTPNVILDFETGYMFPFRDADRLAGLMSQLTLSVSLW